MGNWDSEEHLNQATGILVDFINQMRARNNGWNREQQLKGLFYCTSDICPHQVFSHFALPLISFVFIYAAGIAAYNKGPGNIPNHGDVDVNTTGRDYSNDVVARAQWYKTNQGY